MMCSHPPIWFHLTDNFNFTSIAVKDKEEENQKHRRENPKIFILDIQYVRTAKMSQWSGGGVHTGGF